MRRCCIYSAAGRCWTPTRARYLYAQEAIRDRLVASSEAYYLTVEAMKEGNPQQILERGEKAELPPNLIIQGTCSVT